jgi:hypothetical protein
MYETGQNPKSIYGQLAAAVDRDDHFDVSTGEQTRDYLLFGSAAVDARRRRKLAAWQRLGDHIAPGQVSLSGLRALRFLGQRRKTARGSQRQDRLNCSGSYRTRRRTLAGSQRASVGDMSLRRATISTQRLRLNWRDRASADVDFGTGLTDSGRRANRFELFAERDCDPLPRRQRLFALHADLLRRDPQNRVARELGLGDVAIMLVPPPWLEQGTSRSTI